MVATTCVPFFYASHKPWFQIREGCELDQHIMMFLLECNGFQHRIACEHLKIIERLPTTFMSLYSLIGNKY